MKGGVELRQASLSRLLIDDDLHLGIKPVDAVGCEVEVLVLSLM